MRNSLFVVGVFAAALSVAPACATKKFVRTSVGEVNEKVGTMGKSLEETQERVRTAEGRIVEVDSKAGAANAAAGAAQQTANSATSAANSAAAIGKSADARAAGVEAATRKLIFETVLSEDRGKFKLGKAELPDDAMGAIDQMVAQLKADPKAVWVEIEGHTDNVGDTKYNNALGLQRAESVKRYLYEKHLVPLHKINVISYGEEKPIAPNKTRDGRAQNRRVVIKVLA
ncbi:MAG: OmpA family protein [Acidobacteriota bacterium]|nr:OmpA family protein [Acidobacteriota bacterium]